MDYIKRYTINLNGSHEEKRKGKQRKKMLLRSFPSSSIVL